MLRVLRVLVPASAVPTDRAEDTPVGIRMVVAFVLAPAVDSRSRRASGRAADSSSSVFLFANIF